MIKKSGFSLGYLRAIKIIIIAFAVQCFAVNAVAKPVVIGYVPAFRAMTNIIDTTDLGLVTHINISFLNPDANGTLIKNDSLVCMPDINNANTNARDIRYLVNKAHEAGVKVLMSVAGGVIPSCAGDWSVLLQPDHRQALVNELIKFVDDFNLDGLDVDIEGEVLTKIDKANNYTPFIQALSEQLKSSNKLLTCATASYEGGMIPVSAIPYFDFVNIMSYDLIGPGWGTPGVEHSSYAQAVADVNLWKARGLPQEKLVLGVPFYGYGFGTYLPNYTYKEILDKLGVENNDKDLVGNACAGCSYVTYNGINTIKNKTRFALQNGAGVMIWELSQDASGDYSLLKAINSEIQKSNSTSSAATSSVVTSKPATNESKSSKSSGGFFRLIDINLLIVASILLFVTRKSFGKS